MNIVKEDLQALSTLLQVVSKRAKFLDMSVTEIADVYNAVYRASQLENKLKQIVNAPAAPAKKAAPRKKPAKKVVDATK